MKLPISRIIPAAALPPRVLWAAGISLLLIVLVGGGDPKPTLEPPPLSPGGSP